MRENLEMTTEAHEFIDEHGLWNPMKEILSEILSVCDGNWLKIKAMLHEMLSANGGHKEVVLSVRGDFECNNEAMDKELEVKSLMQDINQSDYFTVEVSV